MRQNPKYKIILAALLISLCNSCKDTGPINYQNSVITIKPQNLSLSTNEVYFPLPLPASSTFQVLSTNIEWEITGIPDWITVNPTSGFDSTTVTVTVTENTLTSNRVGILSFRSTDDSWSYSNPLTVSQHSAFQYAVPETDRLEFNGTASTATIKITSNTENWEIKTNSSVDWCTVSKVNDSINISVTENLGKSSRSVVIGIITADDTKLLTILQHPAKISSITDQLDFDGEGGITQIEIESELPWAISTNNKWITVSPTSGPAGKSIISISILANSSFEKRVGYIYLALSKDNQIAIRVIQEALIFDFDIDNTEIESPSSGGEYSVYIESSRPWSVIDCPSWIHLTPSRGIGSGTVKISVDPNTVPYERYGYVTVSPDNMDYPFYIDVWQAPVITSDNKSMHFSDISGYLYLSINTDLYWTAVPSDNWILLGAESGYGDTQLKVSVTENIADTVRNGFILITCQETQFKVIIEQQGKYLNIQSSALNYTSGGGSSQVTLSSNDNWTTSVSDDWISLQATEGTGDCVITITAADNPSVTSRNGYVDFIPVNSKPVRLNIEQEARYLKVSPTTIHLSGQGGNNAPITIKTEGTVQVTTQDSWLSINKESNSRFTITATANENPQRTGTVTVSLTDLIDGTMSTTVTITQDNKNEPFNNGHEYVDLGLSVLWATCNVEANKPEGFGYYYGWGEFESKYRYTWTEYRFCIGESPVMLSKYNTNSNRGRTDNITTLEPSDDVAHVLWGGNWRMPTADELRELKDNCTWSWTQQNGVNGYRITSNKSGFTQNSIFLPASGSRYDLEDQDFGDVGRYWSSSLDTSDPTGAWHLTFDNQKISIGTEYGRDLGRTVRPVCP